MGEGPAGRVWAQGYREWAPPPALRTSVACVWTRVIPPAGQPVTLVLPDACSDLIWQRGRGAGGPALGMPLSALLDQRVDVTDLGLGPGVDLARLLPATLAPAEALRLLVSGVGGLISERPVDRLAAEAARLLGRPRAQVDAVAAHLGVSERQLRRRCRAAVGYGPATLRRVLRFRRFVSQVDAGGGPAGPAGPDLARLASETGYADQAHLSRECARLAGLPPAALAAQRRYRTSGG